MTENMRDNESLKKPSIDRWLEEAKADPSLPETGMYLVHNGVVRKTPRAKARGDSNESGKAVTGMDFFCDRALVDEAVAETLRMEGIFHVRTWLAEGRLKAGDDIMYVLIGGDIRPHVVDALNFLVGRIKSECVEEIEIF